MISFYPNLEKYVRYVSYRCKYMISKASAQVKCLFRFYCFQIFYMEKQVVSVKPFSIQSIHLKKLVVSKKTIGFLQGRRISIDPSRCRTSCPACCGDFPILTACRAAKRPANMQATWGNRGPPPPKQPWKTVEKLTCQAIKIYIEKVTGKNIPTI